MSIRSALQRYVKTLFDLWHRDAREESLYPALKELIEDVGKTLGHGQIDITVLPKKTEAGNPDFRIWDGHARIIGYIEAKKPDIPSLENLIYSEQIERYRTTFQNFILTDFVNFYLFRNGELMRTVSIARKELLINKIQPPVESTSEFKQLLEDFFLFSTPAYRSAQELARVLAYKTQFLRDQVLQTEIKANDYLKGLKEVVDKQLVHGLSDKQFVDMYAQTLTYGLFAARMRMQQPQQFTRLTAINYIPKSIGVLYELFKFISVMADLPKSIQVIVEDIIDVLRNTDVNAILHQYRAVRGDDDPIVHFYETFLAEYDPDLRERRGIYYTPLPVVKYIVSAVDYLLKNMFQQNEKHKDGLADRNVKILDPAAGTITFLAQAIHTALKHVEQTYGSGFISQIIEEHILKNFYGFELMMAPYVIGHIKAGFTLEEYGYILQENERFPLYLTNTLEMHPPQKNRLFPLLSQEGEEALKIKQDTPILVIIGNPPYSGHSANQNEWIDKLLKEDIDGLQSYYKVDGQPLGEKNPKWLQDDYVKFLRFAQWKINKHGRGIVAMITNHSYLDNPTFRGMRQSLLKTFDEIYILDLHGNSLKKEKTPDGKPDENVFDIRQGVAIGIFVKYSQNPEYAKVFHADLYGSRQDKYQWLTKKKFNPRHYKRIKPQSPFYFFVRRDDSIMKRYNKWKGINEIFPLHSVGLVTARDEVTIKESPEQMLNAVLTYSKAERRVLRQLTGIKDGSRLEQFRKDVSNPDKKKIVPILYRPFDVRYTYYTGIANGFHERPRKEVMSHMLVGENLGIVVSRQSKASELWRHVLIADNMVESSYVSNNTSEIGYLFPLYVYPIKNDLFNNGFTKSNGNDGPRPNIDKKIWNKLQKIYGSISPEDVLHYIYAVLYSNVYRERYNEFLKYDFPRIPFTKNIELFKKMSELGRQLAELHLLKSDMLYPPVAKFEGRGNNTVEEISYDPKNMRVYINKEQYFAPVSEEAWNYYIGGYQVLRKWLKDRKGKKIDPMHYLKIVTAIVRTIELQRKIDDIYKQVDKGVLIIM